MANSIYELYGDLWARSDPGFEARIILRLVEQAKREGAGCANPIRARTSIPVFRVIDDRAVFREMQTQIEGASR